MSLFRYYGFRDKLVLPKVVMADEGFFMDVEPITVFDTSDKAAIRKALSDAFDDKLNNENETVPTPERWDTEDLRSPILVKLQLKKWLKFESQATMYSLHFYPDKIDYYSTGTPLNGTWNYQQARHISMARDESSSLLDIMMTDLETDQSRQSEKPKGGLVLLPPPSNP
jgi:hypothetical protein